MNNQPPLTSAALRTTLPAEVCEAEGQFLLEEEKLSTERSPNYRVGGIRR
jgi:hypothetical protein